MPGLRLKLKDPEGAPYIHHDAAYCVKADQVIEVPYALPPDVAAALYAEVLVLTEEEAHPPTFRRMPGTGSGSIDPKRAFRPARAHSDAPLPAQVAGEQVVMTTTSLLDGEGLYRTSPAVTPESLSAGPQSQQAGTMASAATTPPKGQQKARSSRAAQSGGKHR